MGKPHPEWDNLTDSKKLSPKKRETLNQIILDNAAATGLGWVQPSELDRYGLSNALKLAARRAVKQVLSTKVPFDEIIIDGTVNFLRDTPLADRVTIMKKADFLVKEVSAASIIAKVARDNYMIKIAQDYPEYGFDKHVGYGTAAHRQALLEYGICPEHRQSFRPIQEIIARSATSPIPTTTPKSTRTQLVTSTAKGRTAEQIIAAHLVSLGHTIIANNFKTKTYEIDLISTLGSSIYFTEVKYRHSNSNGTPLDQITPAKYQQMQYATNLFLAQHPELSGLQPQLAAGAVIGEDFQFDDWFVL